MLPFTFFFLALVGSAALLLQSLKSFQERDEVVDVQADVDVTVDLEVDVEPLRRFHPRGFWRLQSLWLFLSGLGWSGLLATAAFGWTGGVSLAVAAIVGSGAVIAGLGRQETRQDRDVEVFLPS